MRRPLPLFSASVPSGLRMRRRDFAAHVGDEHAVRAGAAVAVAQPHGLLACERRVEIGRVDDEVVVAQRLALEEAHPVHCDSRCETPAPAGS
jgi:hypothetical protein